MRSVVKSVPMTLDPTLDEWLATAAGCLDIDLDALGEVTGLRTELLDVARDAAHGVARPAAPLTTFLLGVAVGRGMTVGDAAAAVRRVLPEPKKDDVERAEVEKAEVEKAEVEKAEVEKDDVEKDDVRK